MTTRELQEIWPQWEIVKLLGEGSYGKVYEIQNMLPGGKTLRAAMKVLHIPKSDAEIRQARSEGMDDQSVTEYFRGILQNLINEIDLLSRLTGHSNIVSYQEHAIISDYNVPSASADYDVAVTDRTVVLDSKLIKAAGETYDFGSLSQQSKQTQTDASIGWTILIRMELLTPLEQYLKDHPLSQAEVLRLGIDVCKALEVCAKNNIIHRDIKPANIFVSPNGDFKLGDFGVAREMEKTTMNLSRKGTYAYMAPEVFNCKPYKASADIYSLGIVLYALLNGNRTPFLPPAPNTITLHDRTAAQQQQLQGKALPSIAGVPDAVNKVILRMCSGNPNARYQKAEELRTILEKLLAGEPAKKPFSWRVAAIVGAVVVLIAVVAIVAATRPGPSPGPTTTAPPTETTDPWDAWTTIDDDLFGETTDEFSIAFTALSEGTEATVQRTQSTESLTALEANASLPTYVANTVYTHNGMEGSYTGYMLNGVPEGNGKFEYSFLAASGGYDGEWGNGLPNGYGEETFNTLTMNGVKTGYFKDGLLHGQGTDVSRVGTITTTYTGEWKNGKKDGYGTETGEAILGTTEYVGEWKDNVKHGYGTSYFNGELDKQGQWAKGQFIG